MTSLYDYSNENIGISSKHLGKYMKKKIILLTFLGTLGSLLAASNSLLEYEEPMALFIGDVIFDTPVDPDLCLYYKGNKLQLDINHDKKSKRLGQVPVAYELVKAVPYTLHEAKAAQKFYLLICSNPQCASDRNTIIYWHVPQNISYKFYTFTAARKYNDQGEVDGCIWNVTEEILPDDRIVPDNTIIFLFNADFIEGLEVKSWPVNSNIRLLPSIIVKQTINQDDIIRAIIEARMIAIDFDCLHDHYVKKTTKIENKTVIAIKS